MTEAPGVVLTFIKELSLTELLVHPGLYIHYLI